MSESGPVADAGRGPLCDVIGAAPVVESEVLHRGMVWDVVADTFDLGAAGRLRRDYVAHPGAVAVVALDEDGRVLLVRQYRHPVGAFEWELPAGLLDVPGEAPWVAAARELHEEADMVAARWHTLLDHYASPGGSTESLRLYLARGLSPVPEAERHQRTAEELGMPVRRVGLDEVVEAVLAGELHNPSLALGVLAASRLRARGWAGLRPVDAPWPTRSPGRLADDDPRLADGAVPAGVVDVPVDVVDAGNASAPVAFP
ncbi:MAG: NUDIX domain-containing protein [Dermatophilaceae bacterium]